MNNCCNAPMKKLTPLPSLMPDRTTMELYFCENCGGVKEIVAYEFDAEDLYVFMKAHDLTEHPFFESLKAEFGGVTKMPNWAFGSVEIEGEHKDILDFCQHFIFERKTNKKPFFARSFIHSNWRDFKKEINNGETPFFFVDFAWSATSCLIDGYPQQFKDCITLMDACKQHKVNVKIETEESGIGFEEKIECNSLGILTRDDCLDMPTYKCKCGSEQLVGSSYDIDEVCCYECDEIGEGVVLK